MSSICGLLLRDTVPEGRTETQAMLEALDHWGADARGLWSEGGVGLGHLLLRTTPWAGSEPRPIHHPESGLVLSGDLRLDNREGLAAELGVAPGDLPGFSDHRLALEAWRKWEEEAPGHLLGDFAFAVWDGRQRRLFCVRDPLGVKPLYYHDGPRAFAFASEIRGILALPWVPRGVDEAWVVDLLCRFVMDYDRTLWASVRRLPPGHLLVADHDGARLHRYFELVAPAELHLSRDEEYGEAFREALRVAVARRLPTAPGSEVGAELSGGLDSSGVCAVAQGLLREEGRPFHAFAQVRPSEPVDGPLPADGREAIEAVVAHAGILAPCYLDGGEAGILPALEWAMERSDQPPRMTQALFNDLLYDAARDRGVTVLLSGFGGNQGVSNGNGGLYEALLRRQAWGRLGREFVADGPGMGARQLLGGILGATGLDRVLRGASERRSDWRRKLPYRPAAEELARRMDLPRRTEDALDLSLSPLLGVGVEIARLQAPDVPVRLESADLAMRARRMEYRYPLLDLDLIRFYLSTPPWIRSRSRPGRYLFRLGMEGLLPEGVRWASPTASANPGATVRKRRDAEELLRRVRSISPDSPVLRYADPAKLEVGLPLARPGVPTRRWDRSTEMLQVLILEESLRRHGG